MASDNHTAHEGTLEQPSGLLTRLHKPTLSCLYGALCEADGTLRFKTKRIGLARFVDKNPSKDLVCGWV